MKAVLVIDATKCGDCPFCHKNNYYSWCDAPRKERFWEMPLTSKDIEEERTVECPLRPLPKKFNEGIEYDMDGFGFDKYLETGFKMGWDAYYDKITENHIGENTEKVGETE